MYHFMFEDVDGLPIPRVPGLDGAPREGDGVRFFNLRDAAGHFSSTEAALRELYDRMLGSGAAPTGEAVMEPVPPHLATEPVARSVYERHIAAKAEQLRRDRYDHVPPELWRQFIEFCRQKKLNPWCNQVYCDVRPDPVTQFPKLVIIVGIDGFRLIATRTNSYAGIDSPTFVRDSAGKIVEGSITVYRRVQGVREPFSATVEFEEFYPGGELPTLWDEMPRECIERCLEAKALRKAFPQECGKLYTPEEMMQSGKRRRRPKPSTPFSRMAHAPEGPQTYQQLELALVDLGLKDMALRKTVLKQFHALYPNLSEVQFCAKVYSEVESDPARYGATQDSAS